MNYDVAVVDDEHVLLLSERESHLLEGRVYVTLAELLSGARDVPQILDCAGGRAGAAEIFYALGRLEALGVIREAQTSVPRKIEGFWDSFGLDPAAAAFRISSAKVTMQGLGGVSTSLLGDALSELGIQLDAAGDILLVLVDDYLRSDLAKVNEECLRTRRPWLLARPLGSTLWLGPLLRPGVTACWECLAHRMRCLRTAETYAQTRRNSCYPRLKADYALPSTELAAAALIATETAKWLGGVTASSLEGFLRTIDLLTLTTERHVVVKRPQCPACGEEEIATQEPIRLASRMKARNLDGEYREVTAEETLTRYSHHVSRLTGVVSELSPSTGIDLVAAPVYCSGPNAATRDHSVESLRSRFRTVSSGKGRTDAQARASALCEAIERYSGVYDGDESTIHGSLQSLGDSGIHPNDCMRYSDAQYRSRPQMPSSRYARVPSPFDELAEVEWSPLWSLTANRFKYLPTSYCYYDYPEDADRRVCWADSNGCAAGNSIEEAVLQGFLELVERDSVALWWYNRITRPAVDLRAFRDSYFNSVERYYQTLGRELWVLDVTADLGIPSFVALSRRVDGAPEEISFGFGAHLDARLGISRAITEANQFMAAILAGQSTSSAVPAKSDQELSTWLRTATLANQPYLVPSEGRPRNPGDYANLQHDDLRDDVQYCVQIAAASGLETLVLDQTRSDIGLAVVRVVVPGLRHFWARFGAGRLYEVPVDLGWLPSQPTEYELNPIAVFF